MVAAMVTQPQLPYQKLDRYILLGEAERYLGRILKYPPTRPTLIVHIEKEILDGHQNPINGYWYVSESALEKYAQNYLPQPIAA